MATPRQRAAGCNNYHMHRSPIIKRTQSKAILLWPFAGGRKRRLEVANTIRRALPAYEFNSQRNWFEAPLSRDVLQAAVDTWPSANVSMGVTEILDPEKYAEINRIFLGKDK